MLRLPLKQTLVDTYGAYLAANKTEKPDIWAARVIALEPGRRHAPVVIAVWDSGVDTAIFNSLVVRDEEGLTDLAMRSPRRAGRGLLRQHQRHRVAILPVTP